MTVMARDAMTADALSTAVFLVGPEAGEKLVDSVEGAGALIVSHDNRVIITRRLEGRIKVLHPPSPGV